MSDACARRLHPYTASVLLSALVGCHDTAGQPCHELPRASAPQRIEIIAHRGASGSAPEHTYAAYDAALEQGADYLELDIQLTADDVAVVLHDTTLNRTARPANGSFGCRGYVRESTLQELQACDFGRWFNETYPDLARVSYEGQSIPTLDGILKRYGSRIAYYVELKSPESAEPLEERVRQAFESNQVKARTAPFPTVVQSFSARRLAIFHRLAPEFPLVHLFNDFDDFSKGAIAKGATIVALPLREFDSALVSRLHRQNLRAHAFAVNTASDASCAAAMGIDGVITNNPGLTRAALAQTQLGNVRGT